MFENSISPLENLIVMTPNGGHGLTESPYTCFESLTDRPFTALSSRHGSYLKGRYGFSSIFAAIPEMKLWHISYKKNKWW